MTLILKSEDRDHFDVLPASDRLLISGAVVAFEEPIPDVEFEIEFEPLLFDVPGPPADWLGMLLKMSHFEPFRDIVSYLPIDEVPEVDIFPEG